MGGRGGGVSSCVKKWCSLNGCCSFCVKCFPVPHFALSVFLAGVLMSNLNSDSIFTACRNGNVERVRKYVLDGGCVREPDEYRMTMLHHAAFGGSVEVVDLILKSSKEAPEIDAADAEGWTPLHYACDRGHAAIANRLIDEGANVNAKDTMRKTPLHLCSSKGSVAVVNVLLARGAAKGMKSVAGLDAATYAQENGHHEIVTLLS